MRSRAPNGRIWATLDRTIAPPPQRALGRVMRSAPTEAERKLWWHLRHRFPVQGTHFRRQVQIGRFIADFVSHKAKLVIELDGGQHATRANADAARTRFIEAEGYKVLRFWNHDVLQNVDGVLEVISLALIATTPTPNPSPQGGGEAERPSSSNRKAERALP
jgi:very-short-patch-repair endonuclease